MGATVKAWRWLIVSAVFIPATMAHEFGAGFGFSKHTGLPEYQDGPSSDGDISLWISIFYRAQLFRDYGAMVSASYAEWDRPFGIENIFHARDEFRLVPMELLAYREFKRGKVAISPMAGAGFAFGKFSFSNESVISGTRESWTYTGTTIGFPIGLKIDYRLSGNLRLGVEALFRYYRIDDFRSDYRCGDGGSNAFVFLFDELPGPSCLDSEGQSNKKAFIDYTNANLSASIGFGLR